MAAPSSSSYSSAGAPLSEQRYLQIDPVSGAISTLSPPQDIHVTADNIRLLSGIGPDSNSKLTVDKQTGRLSIDDRLGQMVLRYLSGDSYLETLNAIERTYRAAAYALLFNPGNYVQPHITDLRINIARAISGTKNIAGLYGKLLGKSHAQAALAQLAEEMETHLDSKRDCLWLEGEITDDSDDSDRTSFFDSQASMATGRSSSQGSESLFHSALSDPESDTQNQDAERVPVSIPRVRDT